MGLASSAGQDLAEPRPASFVIVGLFGVALLLQIGISVIAVAQSRRVPRRWRHAATVLLTVVGVGLALRGVAGGIARYERRWVAGERWPAGDLLEPCPVEPMVALGGAFSTVTATQASPPGFLRSQSR